MANHPQEKGTVGLAFIVTNGYEGIHELPGTEYDHENWKQTLKKLKFDVRQKRNATKNETMKFLDAASKIPNEDKHCLRRYVIFVFCGHGEEGVLYSQDLKQMHMKDEILPSFFDDGSNLRMVQKLIFLDACRVKDKTSEHLGQTLSELWKPAKAPAGYFTVCSTPSGYVAIDGSNGSAFSNNMTRLLLQSLTLPEVVDKTRTSLNEEARKKKIEFINACYEDNLGPDSEKNLLNLSESAPVGYKHSSKRAPHLPGSSRSKENVSSEDSVDSDSSTPSEPPEDKSKKSRSKSSKSIKGNRKRSSYQSGSSRQKRIQLSDSDSEETDVLKQTIIDYKGDYKECLRNMVAEHIGFHLGALADNLSIENADGFIANNSHNIQNAAAALLKSWVEGNTDGKTPIWSVLLEAMKKSKMTKEANELEEFLTKGST